jgi:hypothetical protein
MSFAAGCSAASVPTHLQRRGAPRQSGDPQGGSGGGSMLRLARSRLLGRATALTSSALQSSGSTRESSSGKVAAAAQARAAKAEAGAAGGDVATDAKVGHATG